MFSISVFGLTLVNIYLHMKSVQCLNVFFLYLCFSPSYYLYTYDKMVAPNVSLQREAEMSPEMFGALLKHHYSRRVLGHDEPPMGQ